jgi:glycyl-tRNA synthetase
MEDETVTMRDRDSMKQVRIKIEDLLGTIKKFQRGEDFEKLGKLVK